jgi:hypothetical protein
VAAVVANGWVARVCAKCSPPHVNNRCPPVVLVPLRSSERAQPTENSLGFQAKFICLDSHDRCKLFNDGEVSTEIRNAAASGFLA